MTGPLFLEWGAERGAPRYSAIAVVGLPSLHSAPHDGRQHLVSSGSGSVDELDRLVTGDYLGHLGSRDRRLDQHQRARCVGGGDEWQRRRTGKDGDPAPEWTGLEARG